MILFSGNIFRVIHFSLLSIWLFDGIQFFSESLDWSYLSIEFICNPSPIRHVDNPREINEAERLDQIRRPRDQKSPEISNHFSLFGYLRNGSAERIHPGRRSKTFQFVFDAISDVIYLSLIIYSEERIDPR